MVAPYFQYLNMTERKFEKEHILQPRVIKVEEELHKKKIIIVKPVH